MNILFFVVFPIATILIAIVLQRLLRSPILASIFTFAIYLILAYTVYTPEFIINALIYTILAFIAAAIFKVICCFIRRLNPQDNNNNSISTVECMEERIGSLESNITNLEGQINSLQCNITELNNLITNLIGRR